MTNFKVGDRFTVNKNYPDSKIRGLTGTVTSVLAGKIFPIKANLDSGLTGYLFTTEELDPIKVKPTKTFGPDTQCGQILAHLLSGKTLTRITADHLYRVASLTRRIKDLKDAGHKIVSTTKVDLTGRPYVEYSMRKAGR